MGPEGFEPPPTGLKGRHAAATPRPRAGYCLPGYSFDPGHHLSPRYEFCQGVMEAGFEPAVSSSPSLRISQALPHPGHSCEQPVWESNPPLRHERAVSLADRRTSQRPGVGRGALESPSAGLQPAARPSQLPTHSAVPTKRPGVFVTPGLRLRARDVRGRASRPQGIEPERARRRIGGSLRFFADFRGGVTRLIRTQFCRWRGRFSVVFPASAICGASPHKQVPAYFLPPSRRVSPAFILASLSPKPLICGPLPHDELLLPWDQTARPTSQMG